MSGFDIRAEVAAAIAEAGAETGAGVPLTATLIKPGENTGPEWEPVIGEATRYGITILDTHKVARVEGALVAQSLHILKMAVEENTPEPSISDEVEIGGIVYGIADVTPLAPGGVVIMYELTLDR